jgi:hypothetical protein
MNNEVTIHHKEQNAQLIAVCEIQKPTPIEYTFDHIPINMQASKNWLLWKYEKSIKGKWTKVPYQTSNKKASATNKDTWCNYSQALKAYGTGKYDGIGFAIGNSGLTCVDIDHEDEWPVGELEAFESGFNGKGYKEKSPSGNGYHLWLKAVKHKDMGCKSKNFHNSLVEVYNSDRFITMTGAVLSPYESIQEAQTELENVFSPLMPKQAEKPVNVLASSVAVTLEDDLVIQKIKNESSEGSRLFVQLHQHGFTGNDDSADDLAYMNKLAFYTGCDADQMDRIYRTSAIYRPKWDSRRGDSTYGIDTIDKAIQGSSGKYDPNYKGNCSTSVTPLISKASQALIAQEDTDDNIVSLDHHADPFGAHLIDLTKPHGILGAICTEILAMADRPLPMSYPLTGLHILNQMGGKRGGIGGAKINLITMTIAPTASGKDVNLKALSETSITFKSRVKSWIGKPRSDVDIIMNMVDQLGDCSYQIDEAHSLFESMNGKNVAPYMIAVGAEMLNMATTTHYGLSGNHKRQLSKSVSEDQKRLNVALTTEQDKATPDKIRIGRLEKLICKADTKLEMIEEGIPNPTINMTLFSTPENMDKVANASNVESGLMGRCLIWRTSEESEKLVIEKEQTAFSNKLNNRLMAIHDEGSNTHVMLVADAKEMIYKIREYYDQEDFRQHPTKGALYRRLLERVKSIASILGIETGKATVDDVKYALAATLEHINQVEFLRRKNIADESTEDFINHIMDLIVQKVKPVGVSQSIVRQQVLACNKIAKQNAQDSKANNRISIYHVALSRLIESGTVFHLEGTKKLTKK